MIKTEGLHTKVQFGDTNKASIGIRAFKGTVTLQELAKEKKIGDSLDDDDTKELPMIEMNFKRIESVDALIKALETIKKNWVDPNQLAYAC